MWRKGFVEGSTCAPDLCNAQGANHLTRAADWHFSHVHLTTVNRSSAKRILPFAFLATPIPTCNRLPLSLNPHSRSGLSRLAPRSRARHLRVARMSAVPPNPGVANAIPSVQNATRPRGKWSIVIAASVVHALHAAAVYMVPSTLLSPMRHTLNLSVTEITRPLIAYRIIQTLFLLPAGLLLDAVGPQLCLRVAMTAAALSAPLLPLCTSLPQLVILQIFFALTKLIGGLSAMLLIVTSAFPNEDGIGTATSVLLSGYSFAGFLAPAIIGSLSENLGWRLASMLISILFAITSVPLTFCFLKESPSSQRRPSIPMLWKQFQRRIEGYRSSQSVSRSTPLNLSYVTDKVSAQGKGPKPADASPANGKLKEPLLPAPYVLVVASVFAFSFSMHIVFDHLLVFLTEDFGLPFDKATLFMSALNLVALFSKLAVGPVADRYNKSLLLALFGTIAAVSSLLLLDFSFLMFRTTSSLIKVMAFVLFYAIGYAAVFSLTTSVLPEFGKEKLGFRSNFNLMALFASGSLGSYLSAALRSATGSYKWAFVWNAFSWLLVIISGLAKFVFFDRRRKVQAVIPATNPVPSNRNGN